MLYGFGFNPGTSFNSVEIQMSGFPLLGAQGDAPAAMAEVARRATISLLARDWESEVGAEWRRPQAARIEKLAAQAARLWAAVAEKGDVIRVVPETPGFEQLVAAFEAAGVTVATSSFQRPYEVADDERYTETVYTDSRGKEVYSDIR